MVTGRRSALIVACADYQDPGLQCLRAPTRDAEALASVLKDPRIGGFDVRTLLNEPAYVVSEAVEEFFADRSTEDLLLLHFSCHGVKDESGELYFAASNTKLTRLGATGVAAEFVSRRMNRSRSRRIVLLLDCCYAGAFERGMTHRADTSMNLQEQLSGRGRAVITASSSMEYSFESGALADAANGGPSVFTGALVDGLSTGEADRNQDGLITLDEDFILVNSDTFPFADVRSYAGKGMRLAKVLARTPDPLLRAACVLARGVARVAAPLHVRLPEGVLLFARPNTHVLGETYHSAAPLRYGDHIAKVCITPLSDSVKALAGQRIPSSAGDDAHRLSVEKFFAHSGADYEVRVQLCTDPEKMPIEDATVHWSADESRHVPVARIRIPRQDTSSKALRDYAEDVVSFNSWTGLAAHRPLGSINRLKLRVYNASSEFRHRVNGIDRVEPTAISDIPE
ncbi:Uncharacterized protein containing caspase domain [Rhodococcus rhodochrous J45]|uniref:Uncharacterized protein containing caspase domain n=1 Tax=Rhodococcus rhodochrous J45 TaxID=935266 RepID=A0A562E4D3_RHORH|nr:caspase family protein [Rhodococcus rhodochrous]TWH16627.1 Uncharacterized protein containing caspase domain [Rhodococcus rhodochrous J45]